MANLCYTDCDLAWKGAMFTFGEPTAGIANRSFLIWLFSKPASIGSGMLPPDPASQSLQQAQEEVITFRLLGNSCCWCSILIPCDDSVWVAHTGHLSPLTMVY